MVYIEEIQYKVQFVLKVKDKIWLAYFQNRCVVCPNIVLIVIWIIFLSEYLSELTQMD